MTRLTSELKYNGFTLVEILISLVILSMLTVLASSAYTLYIDRWRDNLGGFEQQLSETRSTMLVDQALGNVSPYIVESSSSDSFALDYSFFFFGETNRLEAITGSGIFNYANAGIFKLQLEGNKLVYYERSTADVLLQRAEQSFRYTRKLVYLEGVDSFSLRYFGWPSYKVMLGEASAEAPVDKRAWFNTYNSTTRGLLPDKVELSIDANGKQWTLLFDIPDGSDMILGKYLNEQ